MSLPSADDLFRPTSPDGSDRSPGEAAERPAEQAVDQPADQPVHGARPAPRRPSGRVRHDEKMTVYVTSEELHDLEQARLTLRRTGLTVDRGRLVRAAIALALAGYEQDGEDSALVQRLRDA
ncbi:hypothetical protein [Nocardioides donggukensis]|uniref:hypothetical protein n=1 Tax=Nocardioides donggukensis TaxID=2774019 RepID=UPI00191E90AC